MRTIAAGLGAVLAGVAGSSARAGDAGKRDFPATLAVDEPQVESEFTPALAHYGNATAARETDFEAELSVKATPTLSVILHPAFTVLRPGGSGFQNFGAAIKYQFVDGTEREFIVSAALETEFGGTGSARVGAEPYTTLAPTIFFGKGAGDLPADWAKPLAVTGQAGLVVPTQQRSPVETTDESNSGGPLFGPNPTYLAVAGSLQYNLTYAFANVPGLQVPTIWSGFVPLVEFAVQVPVANNGARLKTTANVDPGFLWGRGNTQVGLEALIPVSRASGSRPGFRAQLAYAFDTPWADAKRGGD